MIEQTDNEGIRGINNRLYALDALRLFAALMVAIFHYCFIASEDGFIQYAIFPDVTKYMYLGVSFFFIISGFVIPFSSDSKTVKSFFVSRVVRLYPAFLFCMPITLIGAYLIIDDPHFSISVRDAILNLTMVPRVFKAQMIDGSYWTLLVEIKFYALISIYLIAKKWVTLDFFIFSWLFVCFISQYVIKLPFLSLIAFRESSLFMIGMLIYLMITKGFSFSRIVLLIVAFNLAYEFEHARAAGYFIQFGVVFEMKYIFLAIISFGILVWISAKITVAAEMKKLGNLTYPFYLLHDYLGLILISLLCTKFGTISSVAFTILSMLIFSYVINTYAEVPAQKLLRNLCNKIK